jgi:hypothetical protein
MTSRTTGLDPRDLSTIVQRWIEQRTNGRVHRLQVEISDNWVTVRGIAGSHYVRQLALSAALDALQQIDGMPREVDMGIHVGAERAR